MRDTKDTFGLVLAPPNEQHKKIRIHLTAHKGIRPEEAVQRSADKIDEIKKEAGHPPEQILSSNPIQTKSGIRGQKAIVGQQGIDGPPYLNRYFFERPDGRIFCVCVYHHGDLTFSNDAEQIIISSLCLTEKNHSLPSRPSTLEPPPPPPTGAAKVYKGYDVIIPPPPELIKELQESE
jgi:hypothetical protein